jgi:hypothetical protein
MSKGDGEGDQIHTAGPHLIVRFSCALLTATSSPHHHAHSGPPPHHGGDGHKLGWQPQALEAAAPSGFEGGEE